jgi:predicted RNA polymerase sigma factor
MPSEPEWAGRLHSVLPKLTRNELAPEAIRLTRAVRRALPDDPEVAGLLALMLLTEVRRAAHTSANGELIPLSEQERTGCNRELIARASP